MKNSPKMIGSLKAMEAFGTNMFRKTTGLSGFGEESYSAEKRPPENADKAAALKEMFTPQRTTSGKAIEYGIGWFVRKSQSGKPIYENSGGAVGGTSQLIIYPESYVFVAQVTNFSDGGWERSEVEAVAEKFATVPR